MLKRITINRIDPLSAGIVLGCFGVAVGLLAGPVLGLAMMIDDGDVWIRSLGGLRLVLGGVVLILAPVFYGMVGFMTGLLMAVVHNTVVKFFGGLVLEVEDDSEDDED